VHSRKQSIAAYCDDDPLLPACRICISHRRRSDLMRSTGSPPPLLRPPSWSQTLAHYHHPPPPFPHAGHSTPPVYSRDFAYANGRSVVLAYQPMRVERASVSGSSARKFAEYVAYITTSFCAPRDVGAAYG